MTSAKIPCARSYHVTVTAMAFVSLGEIQSIVHDRRNHSASKDGDSQINIQ